MMQLEILLKRRDETHDAVLRLEALVKAQENEPDVAGGSSTSGRASRSPERDSTFATASGSTKSPDHSRGSRLVPLPSNVDAQHKAPRQQDEDEGSLGAGSCRTPSNGVVVPGVRQVEELRQLQVELRSAASRGDAQALRSLTSLGRSLANLARDNSEAIEECVLGSGVVRRDETSLVNGAAAAAGGSPASAAGSSAAAYEPPAFQLEPLALPLLRPPPSADSELSTSPSYEESGRRR